jgi:hypothetical protein
MAGTTISSYTTIGVSLTVASQNPVTVSSSGTIAVSGTDASAIYGIFGLPGTIANDGVLRAVNGYGVRLLSGGAITNGSGTDTKASITGGLYGVKLGIHGAGTIHNFGTIASTSTTTGMGVLAVATAAVVNGSASDTTADISGYYSGVRIEGAGASVANFGKITATSTFGSAVYLRAGGNVTNGSATDTVASIGGVEFGVEVAHAAGTIINFGTIEGTGTQFARGIVLAAGGSVVNGSSLDKAAYILADNKNGIYTGGTAASSVVNFGTIRSIGFLSKDNGIAISPGGTVTNGSAGDTTAIIIGERHGVYIRAEVASAVNNFGTIQGLGNDGLSLYLGANVTNGSTADTTAVIKGITGIYQGGPDTISNFATIIGSGTAIALGRGGKVVNGSATDKVAEIVGATGLSGGVAAATVANFGTIAGTAGSAIVLTTGGTVTNGSAADTSARITGTNAGISSSATAATVANFATIIGNGGAAVGLAMGGSVTNGAAGDTTALISGGSDGVSIGGAVGTVANFGSISGPFNIGALLSFGGSVTNGGTADTGASITGANTGVQFGIHDAGTLANFGTIGSTSPVTGTGVIAESDATVVNGATNSTAALITGYYDGVQIRGSAATVTNFGKIAAVSTFGVGVYLSAGGSVINGGAANTAASIASAEIGVEVAHIAGTVSNFGTITGTGPFGRGIVLEEGGSVTNGSSADTAAYIGANDHNAVYIGGAGSSSVVNFGAIKGTGPANLSNGVEIRGGGTVTNGSTADTKATISGTQHGVYIEGLVASAVNNFGTITSSAKSSVSLYLGGNVTNGAAADTTALITGASGVYIGGPGTVANFGTITGTAGAGVSMREGGSVTNGSATDKSATINVVGSSGTHPAIYDLAGVTTIVNFGTISSATSSAIHLDGGGTITNGSTADKTATIIGTTGHPGIYTEVGTVTVTNFGTITGGNDGIAFTNGTVSATATVINAGTISNAGGTAGTAITFGANNDRLVLDPGAKFIGTVSGGGGVNVMELAAGGAGTTGSIGSEFVNFGSVVVDSGASWTLTGSNSTGTVTDNGTLTVGSSASLDITGAVDPASTGLFQLSGSSTLEVSADQGTSDQMKFLGAAEVIIDHAASFGTNVGSTSYAGPLIENFGTNDKIDLKDVTLAGAALNYSTATGLLQITDGSTGLATLAFQNSSLGAGTFHIGNDSSGHILLTHS